MSEPITNLEQGFRVEDWTVRPTAGEIIGSDGSVRHLEPKVMDVLVELARAYPDVLERDDAIRVVWRGRAVADDGLARCVAAIRKALGDSTSAPRYVQTVPKRGYRLVAAVQIEAEPGRNAVADHRDSAGRVDEWSGPTVFDDLRIIRLLGRGAMGVVHLAQETNLERLVAVKTLRGVLADDKRAERRFRREASAAARIDHPNVTSIHRLGALADGTPYIVMQYVRGRTLTALMTSSGELSQEMSLEIVRQIAIALVAAHKERVIHRDIKPGNILIEEDTGLAILSDFGLAGIQETGARIATRLTLHGEVLGNARYISPEQARGDPPTPASDIYSLGVLAYELLNGTYPYPESDDNVTAHLNAAPRPFREDERPELPGLERIVLQALAKEPEQRPTASELAAGMQTVSQTSPDEDNRRPTKTLGGVPAAAWWSLAVLGLALLAIFVSRQ